ncbi:MAG: microcystin-dependent protein, partial [Limisphaerales bacterium]
ATLADLATLATLADRATVATVAESVAPTATIGGATPIGGIIMWNGAVAPAGWALCDGQNGTPDLRGRFVLGSGDSDASAITTRTVGESGGAETHKLTTAQMPSHSHTMTAQYIEFDDWSYRAIGFTGNGPAAGARGTSSTGGNQAHPIMNPFYVLAYIQRVQ